MTNHETSKLTQYYETISFDRVKDIRKVEACDKEYLLESTNTLTGEVRILSFYDDEGNRLYEWNWYPDPYWNYCYTLYQLEESSS